MSIEQVIAEVLMEHRWYFVGNLGVPGMADRRGYQCNCGWETRDEDGSRQLADPDVHVAERIIGKLGLREEEVADFTGGAEVRYAQDLRSVLEDHWGTAWTQDDARLYDALLDWADKRFCPVCERGKTDCPDHPFT